MLSVQNVLNEIMGWAYCGQPAAPRKQSCVPVCRYACVRVLAMVDLWQLLVTRAVHIDRHSTVKKLKSSTRMDDLNLFQELKLESQYHGAPRATFRSCADC